MRHWQGNSLRCFANAEALVYLNRALALTPPEACTERRRLLLIREQVHDVLADRLAQEADIAALADLSAPDDMRAQAELTLRQGPHLANLDVTSCYRKRTSTLIGP